MSAIIPALMWLLLAVAVAGCRGPAQRRYEQTLEQTPEAASHAVHSERLHELMGGLARLSRERLPQAMDVAGEREWREQQIAEVGRSLAASAASIPEASGELGLDAEEQQEFVQLALELRRRAQELAATAPELSPAALRERAAAVERACADCHARFRIPLPGE